MGVFSNKPYRYLLSWFWEKDGMQGVGTGFTTAPSKIREDDVDTIKATLANEGSYDKVDLIAFSLVDT